VTPRLPGHLVGRFDSIKLSIVPTRQQVATSNNESSTTQSLVPANIWTTHLKHGHYSYDISFLKSTNAYVNFFQQQEKRDTSSKEQIFVKRHDHVNVKPTVSRSKVEPEAERQRKRAATITFLFRRPTIEHSLPLPKDHDVFLLLTKTIDLKAIPFKKTSESYEYYKTHFPLLLVANVQEVERCTTPSKRTRTPESPLTLMINRQRWLHMRLADLDCMVDQLKRETDDDTAFVTELYSGVFDPTTWPWNKIDVGGLRRRYTIDYSV